MLTLLVALTATGHAADRFTEAELENLRDGQPVYSVERTGRATRGKAAILVSAEPAAIWREIINYDAYARRMPYVTRSSRDTVIEGSAYTEVHCTMEVTVRGTAHTYKMVNIWYPSANLLLFQMKPDEWSPLQSANGMWRVERWARGQSLVTYHVDLVTAWFVPSSLRERAARGLPRVARAIGKAAEARSGP